MNRKQLMKALDYNGYDVKVYQEIDTGMTLKLKDYIMLNVIEYDGVIVTSRLYAELKVSDSKADQLLHTKNLIEALDLIMYLFTSINEEDRDKVYDLVDLYNLGNDLIINIEGYRFQSGVDEGLFYFEIREEI